MAETTRTDTGTWLITQERARQIAEEGYGAWHDDGHEDAELAIAAAALLVDGTDAGMKEARADNVEDPWGLVSKHRGDRIRQLTIAGALVAAEIDRLLRRELGAATVRHAARVEPDRVAYASGDEDEEC